MRGKFTENRDKVRVKFVENQRKLRGASVENRGKVRSVAVERALPFVICEMIIFSVCLFKRAVTSSFKKFDGSCKLT
jgi:hypothetical protein